MGGDSKLGYVSDPKKSVEESKILRDAKDSIRQGRLTGSFGQGKWFYRERPMKRPEVAVLFSGQGTQYVSMFDNVACEWPEMRRVLEAFQQIYGNEDKDLLTEVMYPRASYDSEKSSPRDSMLREQLKQTKWSQPAIVGCQIGIFEILRQAGLRAKFAAGHSLGELSALWVGGYLGDDVKTLAQVVKARASSMHREGGDGAMLAVVGTNVRQNLTKILREESEVWIANQNSPEQIVLTGTCSFFLLSMLEREAQEHRSVCVYINSFVKFCSIHLTHTHTHTHTHLHTQVQREAWNEWRRRFVTFEQFVSRSLMDFIRS
jgi:acyl transferase domain-containing protein